MKTLRDLGAYIIGGQIVQRVIADIERGDEIVDSQRKTIVAKTVSEGIIDDEGIVVNDYKTTFDNKKITKEGDIVVKLSAPYYAAIIDKDHEGMLVSSFCSIVRFLDDDDFDKWYLVAFLNSKVAQNQLKNRVAGSIMNALSVGKLYDLEIPLPYMKKQKEIGELFHKIINNRSLIKQIMKLEDEKLSCMIAIAEAEENGDQWEA